MVTLIIIMYSAKLPHPGRQYPMSTLFMATHLGIAMGLRGTDVAIETAGVVLATDDLKKIPKLLRIGGSTMTVIKQNLVFAMTVNVVGIGLSVTGIIPPLVASIIHESNAMIVMLNSLRLLRVD